MEIVIHLLAYCIVQNKLQVHIPALLAEVQI